MDFFFFTIIAIFLPFGYSDNFDSFLRGFFYAMDHLFFGDSPRLLLQSIHCVLSKPPILTQSFYFIIQLDAIICIMVVNTVVKKVIGLFLPR